MTLPFPAALDLPVHRLAASFNNTSATYKFYWLLAILDAVQHQQRDVEKTRLFASMLSNAWYTVNYFQVSFGQQDLIQSTVRQIKEIEGISIDEHKQVINERLLNPRSAQASSAPAWHIPYFI